MMMILAFPGDLPEIPKLPRSVCVQISLGLGLAAWAIIAGAIWTLVP